MSIHGINSKNYEITLGYDPNGYFWLIVHFEHGKEVKGSEEEDYLFHNMRDWPGLMMTINDVRWVLSKFNEDIPKKLLQILYEEAKAGGFFVELNPDDFKAQSKGKINAEHTPKVNIRR